MIKEVMVCVQAVVGNNKILFKFLGGHKKDISASLLSCLYSKDEVFKKAYYTIYDLTKILQRRILSIDGNPVCEGDYMFEKGIYLSIFYCLCFIEDISVDMVE